MSKFQKNSPINLIVGVPRGPGNAAETLRAVKALKPVLIIPAGTDLNRLVETRVVFNPL